MKKDFETYLKDAREQEGLPPEARTRMRALLSEYAAMQPHRGGVPATDPSTYSRVSILEAFRVLISRPVAIALILALFFGTSGSLAYAAEGTIPGDALYTFKVEVTEPLRTALVVTPSAQAAWQITLATRRVDEAATLASRDELSTSTQNKLSARFTKNIDAAQLALRDTPTSSDAPLAITHTRDTALTMRLAAYVKVLDTISRTHSQTETSTFRNEVAVAVSTLQSEGAHATMAVALESPTTPTPQISVKNQRPDDVQFLRSTVQKALTQSNEQIARSAAVLSASTTARARAQLGTAANRAKEGENFFTKGDHTDATNAYQDSLGITAQLDVLLYAAVHLKVDAFDDTATSSSDSLNIHPVLPSTLPQNTPTTTSSTTTHVAASSTFPILPAENPTTPKTSSSSQNATPSVATSSVKVTTGVTTPTPTPVPTNSGNTSSSGSVSGSGSSGSSSSLPTGGTVSIPPILPSTPIVLPPVLPHLGL